MPEYSEEFEIFPWDTNFETGIDLIDQQHRKLVDILNRLAAHLTDLSQEETLIQILEELLDYTHYHFETEEKIWHEHFSGDEWLDSHEATHEAFISKINQLQNNELSAPIQQVLQETFSFLSHWLAYHILDTDKRMAKATLYMHAGRSIDEAKNLANEAMTGSMKVLIDTVLSMYDNLSDRTLALMRERSLRLQAEQKLRQSEERWKFVLEYQGESIWDWNIESGNSSSSSEHQHFVDLIGPTSEPMLSHGKIHPDDVDAVQKDLRAHLDGDSDFFVNKHRIVYPDGHWVWVVSRGKVIARDPSGSAKRMIGSSTNVSEREVAALIYQHSGQGMMITDRDNRIISVNPAFSRITGYRPDQVMGHDPRILSSGKHDAGFFKLFWTRINKEGGWTGEIWNKNAQGKTYPQEMLINTVYSAPGEIDYHIALFHDISERKLATEIILENANLDPLTKLPNRRMFFDRLEHTIRQAKRANHRFAVMFIDLDSFKEVNDSLGHNVGDLLLVQVSERLKAVVRESDTISRVGGDEFTIIVDNLSDINILYQVSQKIIDTMDPTFAIAGNQFHITASIGITIYPNDSTHSTELLGYADQAMFVAKKSGGNCFRFFTPAMQQETEYHQRIKNDLYIALQEQQFEVHYQPVIDLKNGTIEKAEALLRWTHPQQGEIQPGQFIHIAEESGLIIAIGDWVVQQVARQLQQWIHRFRPDFIVAINKSPKQFRLDPQHIEKTGQILKDCSINGGNVIFEITEGILMEKEQLSTDQLLALRDMGIEIALDDFGTGYSSMSYLQRFDIDYLKIDRAFVSDLGQNGSNETLCEAIIAMAHKLGLKVIAEGIETRQQLELLLEMDCDYGQGFYFSRALPAAEFEAYVDDFNRKAENKARPCPP